MADTCLCLLLITASSLPSLDSPLALRRLSQLFAFSLPSQVSESAATCQYCCSLFRVASSLMLTQYLSHSPIDATITLEFLPTKNRWLLAMLSMFQPIGVLAASGIAYGFVPSYSCGNGAESVGPALCNAADNRGWRYTLYTVGSITVGVFLLRFVLFSFRESPAYLVNLGKDKQAIEVIKSIAKTNKADKPLFTMHDFAEIDRKLGKLPGADQVLTGAQTESHAQHAKSAAKHALRQLTNVRVLFQNRTMTRLTLLLWIVFIW